MPVRTRWRRAGASGLLRLGGTVVAAVVAAGPVAAGAWAAPVSGAITAVDLVEKSADRWASMHLALDWKVPDGSGAGDTFTLTLPPELKAAHTMTFPLRDAGDGGAVVATAAVSGQVVTFTLTDYAENHQDVHGRAWFLVTFGRSVAYGQDLNLQFGVDGVTLMDGVRVTGRPGDYSATATKWQTWADPAVNNPPRPSADRILWALHAPRITKGLVGAKVTFTDTPGPGQAIACDSIHVFWGSENTGGVPIEGTYPPDRYTTECAPDQLVVTLPTTQQDEGRIPFVLGWSSITDATRTEYRNAGSVGLGRGITIPVGDVLRVDGGGHGTGLRPAPAPVKTPATLAPTDSTPLSPTGTATPTQTTPPSPTGTAPATLFPTAPAIPTDTTPPSPTDKTTPAPTAGAAPVVAPVVARTGASPTRVDAGAPREPGIDPGYVAAGAILAGLGGIDLVGASRRRPKDDDS